MSNAIEVIYDGTCRTCQASRSLIEPLSTSEVTWISSADLSDAELGTRGLTRREVDEQLWCTLDDGRTVGGVDAISELLATTSWWGRWFGALLRTRLGRRFATPMYRLVAKYRLRERSVTAGNGQDAPE